MLPVLNSKLRHNLPGLLLISITGFFIFSPEPVATTPQAENLTRNFNNATAVFVGIPIQIVSDGLDTPRTMTLRVVEVWKGPVGETFHLTETPTPGDFGIIYATLVFAHGERADLISNISTGTTSLLTDVGRQNLRQLGSGTKTDLYRQIQRRWAGLHLFVLLFWGMLFFLNRHVHASGPSNNDPQIVFFLILFSLSGALFFFISLCLNNGVYLLRQYPFIEIIYLTVVLGLAWLNFLRLSWRRSHFLIRVGSVLVSFYWVSVVMVIVAHFVIMMIASRSGIPMF